MENKYLIAVLLTCHNRKVTTLKSLERLYQCVIPENYSFEVYLVDDGSRDGTSNAIKERFPLVNIIIGNGNLYWNRGMHLAWKTASKEKDFAYYLWLNDDTFLIKEAIVNLLDTSFSNVIICGSTRSFYNKMITYGGFKKNPDRLIIPNGTFQECDYCNGNCVLVPKEVFNVLGNLDSTFHHAIGDFDYSLRARKKGIKLFVAPTFIGFCENHIEGPRWCSTSLSLRERLKSLYSPSSGCYPPQFFIFDNRHNGFFIACLHYITIHLRALLPSLWQFKSR